MWFYLAIIAMLCWSAQDLFSKLGSRPDDRFSHWKMVMAVGLVMGLHAAYQLTLGGVRVRIADIAAYLPASAMYIGSMILGYVGLRYIELSILSPICNSSGAVAALLCFIFLKQRLNAMQTVGVVLVCAGVIYLGVVEMREDKSVLEERSRRENIRYTRGAPALILPIAYCVLDALGTFADAVILETMDEEIANVSYELTFAAMGVFSAAYVLLIRRERLFVRRDGPKLIAAVCETAGQFAYVFALGANAVGTAPIVSAYCLVSVLLGRIFLREKLSWKHYLAIGIAAAGIIILGIMEEA